MDSNSITDVHQSRKPAEKRFKSDLLHRISSQDTFSSSIIPLFFPYQLVLSIFATDMTSLAERR